MRGEPRAEVRAQRTISYPAWIIESQAEDWGKTIIAPDDIRDLVGLHLEQGYSTILLWGFQSWYERKLKGDPALWDAVAELAGPSPRRRAGAR